MAPALELVFSFASQGERGMRLSPNEVDRSTSGGPICTFARVVLVATTLKIFGNADVEGDWRLKPYASFEDVF
jgi:hypothetical protein